MIETTVRSLRIGLDGTCTCHGSRAIRRYVVNLVRGLVGTGEEHEYRLLRVNPTASWVLGDLQDRRLQVRDTRIPARILYPLWHHLGMPPLDVFTGRLDVFHATDMELPRPSSRVPLIWTVHGLNYVARPDLMQPGYVEKAMGWLESAVRHCAHFVAVSSHTARLLEEKYPQVRGKVSAIPLGVGDEFSPEGPKSTLVEGPYILFVGAVAAVKNVKALVEAYTILRQRRDVPHKLVLAGPVDEAYWSTIPVSPFAADIVKTGHVDQDSPRLAELYRGAHVFAFPSYSEGWTSPPLEAMKSGVPVVTSNASSLPETVGDAALQVDADAPEALADALERLVHDDTLRQDLIARGKTHAAAYTWDRMARAHLAVYKQVAS